MLLIHPDFPHPVLIKHHHHAFITKPYDDMSVLISSRTGLVLQSTDLCAESWLPFLNSSHRSLHHPVPYHTLTIMSSTAFLQKQVIWFNSVLICSLFIRTRPVLSHVGVTQKHTIHYIIQESFRIRQLYSHKAVQHQLTTSVIFTPNLIRSRFEFGTMNHRLFFVSVAVVVGLYTVSVVAIVAGNLTGTKKVLLV